MYADVMSYKGIKYTKLSRPISFVYLNSSLSFNPLEVGACSGETCVHVDLAAEDGAEAGDANLGECSIVDEIQRTPGIPFAS